MSENKDILEKIEEMVNEETQDVEVEEMESIHKRTNTIARPMAKIEYTRNEIQFE